MVSAAEIAVLEIVAAAYREHFEVVPDRASVSFVGVEPIEILRYREGPLDHLLSLGMSRHPMTDAGAELLTESGPRAELLMSVRSGISDLWRRVAILAAAPAVEGIVYSVGNRVDIGEPLMPGSQCTGGVLAAGALRPVNVGADGEVVILQLLPATQNELAWARVHGSEALQQRWFESGTDLADLQRSGVDLN
ncbi:MAG: hypothetical protein JWN95_586 [Frankiales bacterium]|nr:hypothetical protein [Frankiales bacterium]